MLRGLRELGAEQRAEESRSVLIGNYVRYFLLLRHGPSSALALCVSVFTCVSKCGRGTSSRTGARRPWKRSGEQSGIAGLPRKGERLRLRPLPRRQPSPRPCGRARGPHVGAPRRRVSPRRCAGVKHEPFVVPGEWFLKPRKRRRWHFPPPGCERGREEGHR